MFKRFTLILLFVGAAHTNDRAFAQGGGNALNFTAASQYVRLNANTTVFAGDFTIEFWMKSTSSQEGYIINNRGTNVAGSGTWFTMRLIGDGFGNIDMAIGSTGGGGNFGSDIKVNDGIWHHCVLVRSGSVYKWYIDGIENQPVTIATAFSNNLPIDIGDWVAFGRQYLGTLDEFRIWNIARSETEILDYMNQSLLGNESGLVYYFNCNEESESTLYNSVIGGDSGTISGAGRVASDISLPVELSAFTAQSNNGKIQLNWSTASESNNAGWEVEIRSQKSEVSSQKSSSSVTLSGVEGWTKIGFIPGKGTTTESHSYEFQVESSKLQDQSLQFRLKQIDLDGKFTYSNILSVDVTPNNFGLSQNYPNPFNPNTVISYKLQVQSDVKLVVFDLLGREVATLVNEKKEAGNYTATFNGANLTSGVYFYKLSAGTFSEIKKMTLVK